MIRGIGVSGALAELMDRIRSYEARQDQLECTGAYDYHLSHDSRQIEMAEDNFITELRRAIAAHPMKEGENDG